MPLKHLLLIFLVIFSWGFSYVATKVGLMELPPFLFATLRFAICDFNYSCFIHSFSKNKTIKAHSF